MSNWIVCYVSRLKRLGLASFLIVMSTVLMLVFRSFVGLYVSGIFAGIGNILWSAIIVTLLQRVTLQELQVRVFANAKAIIAISLPVGAMCAGVITAIFSSYILYSVLFVYQFLIFIYLIFRFIFMKHSDSQVLETSNVSSTE